MSFRCSCGLNVRVVRLAGSQSAEHGAASLPRSERGRHCLTRGRPASQASAASVQRDWDKKRFLG